MVLYFVQGLCLHPVWTDYWYRPGIVKTCIFLEADIDTTKKCRYYRYWYYRCISSLYTEKAALPVRQTCQNTGAKIKPFAQRKYVLQCQCRYSASTSFLVCSVNSCLLNPRGSVVLLYRVTHKLYCYKTKLIFFLLKYNIYQINLKNLLDVIKEQLNITFNQNVSPCTLLHYTTKSLWNFTNSGTHPILWQVLFE